MDLDDLFVTWFCLIDEGLQVILNGKRLLPYDSQPALPDSEVRMMKVVGE